MSAKLTPLASTRIRTSPALGSGSGASFTSRTSGGPILVIQICRMTVTSAFGLQAGNYTRAIRKIRGRPRTSPTSAYGYARLCPAYSERQNALQQVRVVESIMLSRGSELLALRDFGIGVGFNEIWSAVSRQAKVDARVAIEPQCSVDAFGYSLNMRVYL